VDRSLVGLPAMQLIFRVRPHRHAFEFSFYNSFQVYDRLVRCEGRASRTIKLEMSARQITLFHNPG